LAPAETLLAPEVLRAIREQVPPPGGEAPVTGSSPGSDIIVSCAVSKCGTAAGAINKLNALIGAKTIEQPARTIRLSTAVNAATDARAASVIHVVEVTDSAPRIVRGLWSTAGIGDEVAEIFGRHLMPGIEAVPFESLGQSRFDPHGIPSTTVVANTTAFTAASVSVIAATAYFLATLPNAGAEALLSHLTVGAHTRLAEDGRKAVAQMGTQQRASADVLIMFGQAIEREQRRMRSFERFMPQPLDPMVRSRIADMELGITSVWTSMGITSSPFVPAAKRIRGRGGEDLRVPARIGTGSIVAVEPATAFLKFLSPGDVLYELGNFVDGQRSISDIRDAVSAEFGPLPLPSVTDYFDRLAKAGAISIK